MPYQYRTFTYASSDGKNHAAAHLYTPTDKTVRAVVQLSHGALDYVGRYEPLADALCAAGYALCGNDHLGHGQTVRHSEDLGFFAEEDGADTVVTDLHKATLLLRSRFNGAPVILLGQGFGSLAARIYACSYYRDIDGLVLLGTPRILFPRVWRMVANRLARKKGERYHSPFLDRVTFGSLNRRFDRSDRIGLDWLSRDEEAVARCVIDPFCNFRLTASAYADLYTMAERVARQGWVRGYPKSMPTLIASGAEDALGAFGRAPAALSSHLSGAGVKDVTLKLYPGMRHELVSDPERARFLDDLLTWLTERY